MYRACVVLVCVVCVCHALDNGLALTPQMGWNSWNHFACRVNETVVKGAADHIVSSGMAAAGYTYVNIDDCWEQETRTPEGKLTWDAQRFPTGMPALAQYIHSKGLKFGLYSARCRNTCQGRPASYQHEVVDAQTWASWGVDYLKYDNCLNCPQGSDPVVQFTKMAIALNATGRSMFYSNELCNNGKWAPIASQICNSARIGHDISAHWSSMISLVDIDEPLAPYAGPGFFNDADMLEVGNGMSADEDKSHFALWCMLAAPLLAGNDLTSMAPETIAVLTAKGPIAVNQDALGKQATVCSKSRATVRVAPVRRSTMGVPSRGCEQHDAVPEPYAAPDAQVWTKPLADGSTALLLLNRGDASQNITVDFKGCVGNATGKVHLVDVWSGKAVGDFTTSYTATGIASHASVFLKATPSA